LYNNNDKYKEVEVSKVSFTNKTGKLSAEARLCLVFIGGEDEDFIEVVFRNKVETGELDDGLPVKNDSAEFEPQG